MSPLDRHLQEVDEILAQVQDEKRRRARGAGPRVVNGWTPQAEQRFINDAKHVFPGAYEPGRLRRAGPGGPR